MRRHFWDFVRAVVGHWGSLVTSGAFIGVLGIWQGTGHKVPPVVYWGIALAGLFVASFLAWVDERERVEHVNAEHEAQVQAGASASDPWLCLLQERQRLEAELQPLLEIEESGIKVIPAVKVGKSEDDYRREKIERLRRDIDNIGTKLTRTSLGAGENETTPVTPADWQNIAERFSKQSDGVRADWNRTGSGMESWRICGGWNSAECEVLCKLAGAMLLRSPRVSAQLSQLVRAETDSCARWLYFLKEIKGLSRNEYGFECVSGGEQKPIYFGSLQGLSSLSYRMCLECSANEL